MLTGITGIHGAVRWSYFTAAAIHGYSLTPHGSPPGSEWLLSAHVTDVDAFKLAQRPLIFVAPHNKGAIRWPVLALELAGDGRRLTARLGAVLP
jgi:hypothetical protein